MMNTKRSSPIQRAKAIVRALLSIVQIARNFILVAVVGLLVGIFLNAWLIPLLPQTWTAWMSAGKAMPMGQGTNHDGREVAFWKSSMIPNFVSPKPGLDPMGMDLIPVYKEDLGEERFITLDDRVMQNMGLRTVPVVRGAAEHVLRTVGHVDYAEPSLGDVTLKIDGWIEKLFVDFVGAEVHKGQPLFSLYSPDLIVAQQEYLIGLPDESADGVPAAANPFAFPSAPLSPHAKLRYWDVPESQIERVKESGSAMRTLTFESPFDGWVIEKHALEGMEMPAGSRFYRIADLKTLWVYVTLFEYQLPSIQVGQTARLTLPYRPGETFTGQVLYIYPYVDPHTREIQVRLEFPNPDLKLKPGMYADVEIGIPTGPDRLLVPLDGVIDTGRVREVDGESQRVGYAYVMVEHGRFEPREVVLGDELEGGQLEVLSGLREGEQLVVCGQFQLDSERRIKEANLRMLSSTAP